MFAYGSRFSQISGLETLQDAANKAEQWLSRGVRWDQQIGRYVPDMRRRRVVELWEISGNPSTMQKRGSVVAIRYYSGNIVCSTWYGQTDYSSPTDDTDLVPTKES